MKPNRNQKKVIEHTDGPLLVIAGPGSGKTFALVERTVHLICEKKLEPQNLLIATFTEKAAKELITRISNRLLEKKLRFNTNEIYIGTIHSICLRFLKENREYTRLGRNYIIMDQFDQQYFLYQKMWDYDTIENIELLIGNSSRWNKSETLLKWINKVSEENIDTDGLVKDESPQIKALGEAYNLYQKQLEETDSLDFSTIQLEALKLLNQHPAVLEKLRTQIQYFMIDEYQDTNTIQESIILTLAGKKANICVVGDDDQSLYRFRGATVRNILEFPDNFSTTPCKQVWLTKNYRSHPDIIEYYNTWMENGIWEYKGKRYRFDKSVEPRDNVDFPQSPAVFKVAAQENKKNWHEEVRDFLFSLQSSIITDWNQVAFLFKSVKNDKVKSLADYLEENNIPVYSPRSNAFFEREETRLVLGAFLFLFRRYKDIRKWDENANLEIWEYYDGCFGLFARHLREPSNAPLLRWCQIKAKEIMFLYSNADYGFSGLFYELLQFPLFSRYLVDESATGVIDTRPARNLAIFSNLLVKFEYLHRIAVLSPKYLDKNMLDLFNQYIRYLKDGGINEYEDDSEYAPSGCVSFLTIHQSKGLEFPVVVVGSLNAGPRKQHTDLDVILQENYYQKPPFEPIEQTKYYDFQRLYYTAFSRAQNLLILTCQEQSGRGKTPSKHFTSAYNYLQGWRTIDVSEVILEHVKDVNIKREYSFTSHILLYENCAQQYRFYKDLGFSPVRQAPILFGTLVHETIEDIHKAALRGEQDIITPEQVEQWFSINYSNLSKKERVYLKLPQQDAALNQVQQYVKRQNDNWSHIKEAEVEVALVKAKYILKGVVDLIQGDHDTVEIVDFKSDKKPDLYKESEKFQRYRRQLEVYAHVIEERYGFKVSKMHLYYTGEKDGNPYVTFKKDGKNISETINVINKTVERIETKDYKIEKRPLKHCPNCDMRFYCDAR